MMRLLQGIGFFFLIFLSIGAGKVSAQDLFSNWTWIASFSPEDALQGQKIIEALGSLEEQLERLTAETEEELRDYRRAFENAVISYHETRIAAALYKAAEIEKDFPLEELRNRVESSRQKLERRLLEYRQGPPGGSQSSDDQFIFSLKKERKELLSRLSGIIQRNLPEPQDPYYSDFTEDLMLFYRDYGLPLMDVDRLVEQMIERSRSFSRAEKIKEYLQKLSPRRFQSGETDLVALRYQYEILVEKWWSSVLALLDPDALLSELENQAETLYPLSPELSRKVGLYYEELSAVRSYQKQYEALAEESFDAVLLPVMLGDEEYENRRNKLKYFIESSARPLLYETAASISSLTLSSPLLSHFTTLWRVFNSAERSRVVRMFDIPRLLPEIAWAGCERTLLSEYQRMKGSAEGMIGAEENPDSSSAARDTAFSVISGLRTFFTETAKDGEAKRWRVLQLLSDPAAQILLRDSGETELIHKVRAYLSEIYDETDQSLRDKIEEVPKKELEKYTDVAIEKNAAVIVKIDPIGFPALPFDRTVSIEIELLSGDGDTIPLAADQEWLAGRYYDSFQQATLRSVPAAEEEDGGRQSADWSRMHGQSVVGPFASADYAALTGSLVEAWSSAARKTEDPELQSDFKLRAYLQLLRIFRHYLQPLYEQKNLDYRCYMNDFHVFLTALLERLDSMEMYISRFEELLRTYAEKESFRQSGYLGRDPLDFAVFRFTGYAEYAEDEVSDISRYVLIRSLYRSYRRIDDGPEFWRVFREYAAQGEHADDIGADLSRIFKIAADNVLIQHTGKNYDLDTLYSELDKAAVQNIITDEEAFELGQKGEAFVRNMREGKD
jgi:hypothetical protein